MIKGILAGVIINWFCCSPQGKQLQRQMVNTVMAELKTRLESVDKASEEEDKQP